jgi:hypothetical protein
MRYIYLPLGFEGLRERQKFVNENLVNNFFLSIVTGKYVT